MKLIKPSLISFLALCGLSLCIFLAPASAQENTSTLGLWPRGDKAYLAAGQAMPLWPTLPSSLQNGGTLTLTFPPDFSITSIGSAKGFAVLPKPLVVPKSAPKKTGNTKESIYTLDIPPFEPSPNHAARLALMVNPGATLPGTYAATLQTEGQSAQVALTVLPALEGKRPKRLQIGAYNYNGLTDENWLNDIEQAVLKSGINMIWDMHPLTPADKSQSLVVRLADKGIDRGVLWFWHSYAAELGKTYPEAVRKNAEGNADSPGGIASTWIIQNRDKVLPVLRAHLQRVLATGNYPHLGLDFEESAIREREGQKVAYGDLYNSGTVEEFARFAGLDKTPPTDAAFIAEHHAEQWIKYRTWQSTQLSALVADAIQEIDPLLNYSLYSGYEYAPPLAGSSQRRYSVDWHQMATEGKIQSGSAGYYGSAADIQNTARALGKLPFIPAEMYAVNFQAAINTLPEPDAFAARLLSAALNGGGQGINLWYLSVLDAGAYSAIARVSRLLADAEPFLLDGRRADDQLNLPRDIDSANVFAYQLGERRLVIVLNRSAQELKFRAAWKEKLRLPDTTELVSGKKLGDAPLMQTTLAPNQFAAFLTFSDGN